jgi:hypothetical protein
MTDPSTIASELDQLRYTLEPTDDSYHQIIVRDRHGSACGMLPIDVFRDDISDGPIYCALWAGHSVRVVLTIDPEQEQRT